MKKKQILSLILAGTMGLSLMACGNGGTESGSAAESGAEESGKAESSNEGSETDSEAGDDATDVTDGEEGSDESGDSGEAPAYTRGKFNPESPDDINQYMADSDAIYEAILGEFKQSYDTAKESMNPSERYVLMAIAEAKLLESGVMMPLYSAGGNYAISRVAPYTGDYTMWGSDQDRFHQYLVCTDPILPEHRDEMKAKWAEVRGTGTYEEWAKNYLVEKGYTLKDTYTTTFNTDLTTWDVLSTDLAADSNAIINTFDGLLEYDVEGYLQPALAES